MHFELLNIVMAASIGLTIGLIATIHNEHLKATIYSIPVSVSLALIATRGNIGAGNVIGLGLLCVFLWLVYVLYRHFKMPILWADIVAALAYLIIGYVLLRVIDVSFIGASIMYLVSWCILVGILVKTKAPKKKKSKHAPISPIVKTFGTGFMAFLLLNAQKALDGIVVTFPFSGVFAVIELKDNLYTLASVFLQNSIAILGLFCTLYVLQPGFGLYASLAIGWAVYLLIFKLVQKIDL